MFLSEIANCSPAMNAEDQPERGPGPPPKDMQTNEDAPTEPPNDEDVFKRSKKLNRTPQKKQAQQEGTEGNPKRKGSPLTRSKSCSEGFLAGEEDPKRLKRETWFQRLGEEVKALNKLIAAAPTTSVKVKTSARKLITLWEAEQFDRISVKAVEKPNPDIAQEEAIATREMSTQTPASVQAEFTAEDIRAQFEQASCHEDILARDWPRATYRRTSFTRGGLFKPRTDALRVILCKAEELATNPAILRLSATYPTLKQLNEDNLPAGKSAVVKCGEEIVIDGQENSAGKQMITVRSLHSTGTEELVKVIREASQEARGKVQRIVLSFPPELDPQRARKIAEISADVDLHYEVPTIRPPKNAHPKERLQHRPTQDGMSSFTITPSSKDVTLADIVKGMHNGVNPQEMGVQVRSVRETRNGNVQVRFKENCVNPAFYGKVKTVLSDMATCHQRTGAVIINDIEAGAKEEDVTKALAEALGIDQDQLNPSRISSSARGRSMIVGMPVELTRRALRLKTIGLNWTRAKIREKIDPDFCDFCQLFGHQSRSCTTKKPVGKRCFNCGSLEHLRAACKSQTACPTCNDAPHRMNSMACPVFRDLVHQKRSEHQQ